MSTTGKLLHSTKMPEKQSKKVEEASKSIDLSPNKEIYRSAAVDVDPIDAVEELVDNALDNWARVSQRVDNVHIDITADGTTTTVRDDTGGLGEDNIQLLFALGETFQEDVAGSIGAYGIGAKKALVRLGEDRIVKSRARDGETGIGFRVDEDWLDSGGWEVELSEYPDLEQGVTVLETEATETVWDQERVSRLKETLRSTYGRFLERSAKEGSVTITVNGDELQPPEEIPWSYSPFDGLHPRKFESIELYPGGVEAPVMMDVTVGLMRHASAKESGTDIYIQDRLVTKHETGEVGGFGSVSEDRIGNFTSHNNRLRVVVELRTDGDSADLPWDGQKTTVDPYHPVSRTMYDWLRRIVRPYFKAGTGKVPKAFVEAYTADHDYAGNGGEIEVLDYTGRAKVNDKPDKALPSIKEVRKTAENHAKRGIIVADMYSDGHQLSYETHLEKQFKGDDEEVRHLTRDELDESNITSSEEEEGDVSFSDFVSGVKGAGASKEEGLREAGYDTIESVRVATVDELTAADGIGTSLAEKLISAAEEHLGDEDEEQDSDATLDEYSENESEQAETGETESDDETESSTDLESTEQESESKTPERDTENDVDDNQTAEGLEASQDAKPGHVRIPIEMSEDEFAQLRDRLGLDEEAAPEDIGKDLKARILAMFAPAQ